MTAMSENPSLPDTPLKVSIQCNRSKISNYNLETPSLPLHFLSNIKDIKHVFGTILLSSFINFTQLVEQNVLKIVV
jgi:hypothetical protein